MHERRRSICILLAGTSGTGKSTLAGLLAARLGITTLVSTDSVSGPPSPSGAQLAAAALCSALLMMTCCPTLATAPQVARLCGHAARLACWRLDRAPLAAAGTAHAAQLPAGG